MTENEACVSQRSGNVKESGKNGVKPNDEDFCVFPEEGSGNCECHGIVIVCEAENDICVPAAKQNFCHQSANESDGGWEIHDEVAGVRQMHQCHNGDD